MDGITVPRKNKNDTETVLAEQVIGKRQEVRRKK